MLESLLLEFNFSFLRLIRFNSKSLSPFASAISLQGLFLRISSLHVLVVDVKLSFIICCKESLLRNKKASIPQKAVFLEASNLI